MDLDDLRQRLAAALARRGLGVPGPLEELTGGWASTSVLACALSAPGAGTGPPTEAVLKLYAADDNGVQHAAREHRVLAFLAGTACRVPAVLAFDSAPAALGRPFLLMERVPGRTLWATYESADDDERRRLVSAFVQPLVALHALDAEQLEPAAAQAQGYGAIDAELAGLHRDAAAFPRSGLGDVVRWLREQRDDVACERPVVQHRDHHPWNVIVGEGDGDAYVLDWDWRVGDARFDVAWTCTLVARSGHAAFSAAVRDEYARQSGAALGRFETFEVLTTVRWLLNVLPALGPGSQLAPSKREDFHAFLVEPLRRARALLRDRTGLDAPLTSWTGAPGAARPR